MERHMSPVSLVKKSLLNPNRSQDLTIGQEMQGTEQNKKHHGLVSESPLRGTRTKTPGTECDWDHPGFLPVPPVPGCLLPSREPTLVTTRVTVLVPLTNWDHRQDAYSLGSSAALFLTQDKKCTTSQAGRLIKLVPPQEAGPGSSELPHVSSSSLTSVLISSAQTAPWTRKNPYPRTACPQFSCIIS